MLTISPIAAQAVRDYYTRMANLSIDKSYWHGQGSLDLGYKFDDTVDPDHLYALCAIGPKAAKDLANGEGLENFVISDIGDHQEILQRRRRPGYDLTFSAPKSISLACLAHPSQKTRDAVSLAHRLAVNTALRFLEEKAGLSRLTVNGEASVIPAKMIFAGFTHFTNRNEEPDLHTHALLPNVVHCEDGKWRALHNDELHQWYLTAGALYRASLRSHVNRLTDAEWSMKDGWKAEISGLAEWEASDGANLLKAFSQRHEEVVELRTRLESESPSGTLSPKVRRSLAVRTRKAKDFGQGDAKIDEVSEGLRKQLEDVWKLGPDQWREIFEANSEPQPDTKIAGLWLRMPNHLFFYGLPLVETSDDLMNYMAKVLFDEGGGQTKEGVLSGKAYVSVQDIHSAAYNLFGGFVESDVLEESIKKLLSGGGLDEKLQLMPIAPAVYVKGKTSPLNRIPIRYYATRATLNSEARVLELADIKTNSGVLDGELVDQYLVKTIASQRASGGHILADEQQNALKHLFNSDTTATLLMGAQGSGKTTLFSHFSELARSNGVTVWGLAPQGTAVNKLGDTLRRVDPNAKSMTIESFVGQVNWGSLKIPENTCIILDESSQVDTLELAETLEIVANAGAKLILVGDDRQLGSVRYGGMFATLFAKLGGARMVETRRASDAWDRTAQAHLRMGDLKGAIRIYEQKERISIVDDHLALTESTGDWLKKEFQTGSDSFVITNTKAEEMAANALAHEVWNSHREQGLRNYLDSQVRHHRMSYERRQQRMKLLLDVDPVVNVRFSGSELTLRMGDVVAIRRTVKLDKNNWLTNGQRGQIVNITDKAVTLFIQEESTAKHVSIPRSLFDERENVISYGWASTVFRTQAMELGMGDRQVDIADTYEGLSPDTPVLIKRTTHRSKNFEATFLEDRGEKVSVRLKNGKVRNVAKTRVSVADDTKSRIEKLAVAGIEGNALVLGTEGMNLDALLVAASRARQRTDFVFRSIMATENDLSGEKLLSGASDQDIARSTMALYLARQSRPEQPDSAYLSLAREREAITLAATVDLPHLESLRTWLSDNLTAGSLNIAVDVAPSEALRDQSLTRLARLESQMDRSDDLQYKAHLASEIEQCAAEIDYVEREITRIKIFADFVGHATGALGDKEGKVVVDERYVRDRLSLVDEAIAMAEDMGSWTEITEAIVVPLPENTAREVVDVSSSDKVELDTKAKLFSSVSYRVASDWMRLADGLYDKMLAEGLAVDEVLATVDVSDDNKLRLRESLAAVAVGRSNPTPVGHPVTLRTAVDEALAEDADAELVAMVEQMTESVAEHKEHRAEWNSRETSAPVFGDVDGDDGDGDFWNEYENTPMPDEEGNHWIGSEPEPMPEYRGDEDEYDLPVVQPPISSTEQVEAEVTPTATSKRKNYSGGFFYKNDEGVWVVDLERRKYMQRIVGRKYPMSPESAFLFDISGFREIEPGSGEFYDPKADTEMVAKYAREKAERDAYFEEQQSGRSSSSSSGSGEGQSEGRSPGGYGKSY